MIRWGRPVGTLATAQGPHGSVGGHVAGEAYEVLECPMCGALVRNDRRAKATHERFERKVMDVS